MTMVIITGGIDLSVGSLIALSAVATAWCIQQAVEAGNNTPMMIIACCGVGVLVCAASGLFSGLMVTVFKVPPFIVTLAMMLIASGFAFRWSSGQSIKTPAEFTWLGRETTFGIPNGVCWVDDVLTIEPESGRALASAERGMDVSPLGDVVCGRYYDNLPKGGAGQQAVDLLPSEVVLDDGRPLRFIAETVSVFDDAVAVAGIVQIT